MISRERKKTILKLLVASALMLLPSLSSAAAWTPWVKVSLVYTYSTGYLFVQLTPSADHINPEGCVTKAHYQIPPDAKNFDEMYQMLLTAKAAGLRVSAYISGCSGNYPKLVHLRMIE